MSRGFPRGQRKAVEEELGNGGAIDGARCDHIGSKDSIIGRRRAGRHLIQRNQSRAFEAAERVRLRSPVQIAKRTGIPTRLMLGALVVVRNGFQPALRD
ncbi:MAG: hypothetical protein U9P11_03730 [Pseudomonadota bacterium]|nr:hypothetical protein [Pseudomonadota bacterium]